MDITSLVPFRHSVKYKTWTRGYSAQLDSHDRVVVLST